MGGITWATPTYFFIAFGKHFKNIFKEVFKKNNLKSYYFIKVYV
jgi:hypothetical protein